MTPLAREIAAEIAQEGPISVERFMRLALTHPRHGYYMSRDPLGAAGDFITAPEISQMFGELIGLWAADCWRLMGRPDVLRLVELGPGRGTLMADALRATRRVPGFHAALDLHLVEASEPLIKSQRAALAAQNVPMAWHRRFAEVPAGPTLLIANELFDALPIRQYVRGADGWRERLVGLADGGEALAFGLSPHRAPIDMPAETGAVLEVSLEGIALARNIAERIEVEGGAALIIDYGHAERGFGDTLQAMREHRFADPLAQPGLCDLTAHVDFASLGGAARAAGAHVHGPVRMSDFLRALGIEARAERLRTTASPAQAAAIDAALARLTGGGDGEMGALFKVMAIAFHALRDIAGFAPAGS